MGVEACEGGGRRGVGTWGDAAAAWAMGSSVQRQALGWCAVSSPLTKVRLQRGQLRLPVGRPWVLRRGSLVDRQMGQARLKVGSEEPEEAAALGAAAGPEAAALAAPAASCTWAAACTLDLCALRVGTRWQGGEASGGQEAVWRHYGVV